MDAVEVAYAVEERRVWLQHELEVAAERFQVALVGPAVNTYDLRSAGAEVADGGSAAWLRIVLEDVEYQPACRWDDWHDTGPAGRRWRLRGELMTLAPGRTLAPDSVLHGDPELSDRWWAELDEALRALAAQPAPQGDTVGIVNYTIQGARAHFDNDLDPAVTTAIEWTTAHADLHWGNLREPRLHILDWESWRRAPAGYDVATLYCNSLTHRPTAQRLRDTFPAVFTTPSGQFSLLSAVCRYLWVVGDGSEYDSLAGPLHALGAETLRALRSHN